MPAQTRKGILAAVVAVAAVAIAADVVLWLAAPVSDPYAPFDELRPQMNQYIRMEYPRNYAATTESEEFLSGMETEGWFTTNNMGFRGQRLEMPKPPGEFRVFLVGGSTAECFYLDDENEMGAVTERVLDAAGGDHDVAVYNVGLSGSASDDHVAMIGQRLVHLEPDLIVVFAGINDLMRSINDYDYLHYVTPRPAYRKPWYKRFVLNSQIARRVYFLRRRIDPADREVLEERRLKTNYAGKMGLQRTVPDTTAPPPVDTEDFERNLVTIVGMARSHGFELVLMTHPTTWNSTVDQRAHRFHWMRYRDGVTYREDLMDAAMARFNDTTRRVGDAFDVPVYDLAAALPKSLEYFYDDCHFNIAGAHAAGDGLARVVLGHGLIAGADPGSGP